eukprot:597728_1
MVRCDLTIGNHICNIFSFYCQSVITFSTYFHDSVLIFINTLITLFLIISSVSTVYFTVNLDEFSLIHRAIDLLLNWVFVVLLCLMYRHAMERMIKSDASKNYNFAKTRPAGTSLASSDALDQESVTKNSQLPSVTNTNDGQFKDTSNTKMITHLSIPSDTA